MKYKSERVVECPQETAWALFVDPEQRKNWQPALESVTLVGGEAGQPDAVTELIFADGGRRGVTTETITERREPHFLATILESKTGHTLVVNTFAPIDRSRTRLTRWFNHRFRGMEKLKAPFAASRLRRQAEDELDRFKLLAETGGTA